MASAYDKFSDLKHTVAENFDVVTFWPKCVTYEAKLKNAAFEDFDGVIKQANAWLISHPSIDIKKVETVEQKVGNLEHLGSGYMQFLTNDLDVAYRGSVVNLYGVRIWFYKHSNADQAQTQTQLAYIDIIPRNLTPEQEHPTFDLLSVCVDQLNTIIQQRTMPGSILTVETVAFTLPEHVYMNVQNSGNPFNSKTCAWLDEYGCYPVSILRAFYITGSPTHGSVGFCDFLPDCVDAGGMISFPTYAPFNNMFCKVKEWISQNPHVEVANIQTLHAVRHNGGFETQKMVDVKISSKWRLKFIRIFTLNQQEKKHSRPFSLTYKAMMPLANALLKGGTWESIYQREGIANHIERVRAWLQATGASVLSVETICFREYPPKWDSEEYKSRKGAEDELTVNERYWRIMVKSNDDFRHSNMKDGVYRYGLVYGFRFYFDSDFQEPSPDLLPPVPDIEGDSDCQCDVL